MENPKDVICQLPPLGCIGLCACAAPNNFKSAAALLKRGKNTRNILNVNIGDNIIIYGKRLVSDSIKENECIDKVIVEEVFAKIARTKSFQVENYYLYLVLIVFVFSLGNFPAISQ